mgnify:CR=1 FL=1
MDQARITQEESRLARLAGMYAAWWATDASTVAASSGTHMGQLTFTLGAVVMGAGMQRITGMAVHRGVMATFDRRQEATAADHLELTQLLGGTPELGLISAFAVDAEGELYIVSYAGAILKIETTGTPPSPPTNLRIIR